MADYLLGWKGLPGSAPMHMYIIGVGADPVCKISSCLISRLITVRNNKLNWLIIYKRIEKIEVV